MTTLDGLVTALSEQQGWADVTAPTDITVNGYAGKRSNAPPQPTSRVATPSMLPFRSWETDGVGGPDVFLTNRVRSRRFCVLDVNGTIIIINTVTPDDREDPAAAPARRHARLDPHRTGMSLTRDHRLARHDALDWRSERMASLTRSGAFGGQDCP